MPIDLYFPTPIYSNNIAGHSELNKKMLKKINSLKNTIPSGGENWYSNMYNTCATYDLANDDVFKPLLTEVTTHVNNFAEIIGADLSKKTYKCVGSWFNICKKGNYQDAHFHTNSTFSGVYYLSVPPGSANIIFESPLPPNTHPIPIKNLTVMSFQIATIVPEVGKFIIFPSYLRHSVKQHNIDKDRISIAFNFD